jgi:predicted metal-dependent HD superfamily phosphohydrolase
MRLLAHASLVHAARLHYAQPHRGYHNAGHLDELIVLARERTPDLDEAEQLALLFHDAVYVPGAPRGENERLSALLMRATMAVVARADSALAIAAGDLDTASRIIEATAHAEPPPAEAARICDLDLWRLAAPWEAFQQHALGIRHEYLHLFPDEAAFWQARNSFYESMLAKSRLFATDAFVSEFEARARENMQRAVQTQGTADLQVRSTF